MSPRHLSPVVLNAWRGSSLLHPLVGCTYFQIRDQARSSPPLSTVRRHIRTGTSTTNPTTTLESRQKPSHMQQVESGREEKAPARGFEANGYPPTLVKKTLSKCSRHQDSNDEEKKRDILCLPYIRGLSEAIEKVTKDLNIRAVFKSHRTLRKLLMKVKSPRDPYKHKGVVYSIPCECGKEYVGEIGRTLSQQMTEHKRAVRNNDLTMP